MKTLLECGMYNLNLEEKSQVKRHRIIIKFHEIEISRIISKITLNCKGNGLIITKLHYRYSVLKHKLTVINFGSSK